MSAWGPRISPSSRGSLRNCTPLFAAFGASFTLSESLKSSTANCDLRKVFFFKPFSVLPTISPLVTDQTSLSPSQPVRSLPLNASLALSVVASIGTWAACRRYAINAFSSASVVVFKMSSGIMESSDALRVSMSPTGMVEVSVAVTTVRAALVSSFTIPVTTRPSRRPSRVAAYSLGMTALGSRMFSRR